MFPRRIVVLLLTSSALAQQPTNPIQNPVYSGTGQQATPTPQRGKPAPPPPVPAAIPAPGYRIIPFAKPPELTPGLIKLAQLEADFADAVEKGGGPAFTTFFAEDAVILNNGQPAILGRGALTQQANWDPRLYQLTWSVEGAQMSAAEDMGFTWGRYVGKTVAPTGAPGPVTTGRFITIWRKQKDGAWKVALDASADAPPLPAGPR